MNPIKYLKGLFKKKETQLKLLPFPKNPFKVGDRVKYKGIKGTLYEKEIGGDDILDIGRLYTVEGTCGALPASAAGITTGIVVKEYTSNEVIAFYTDLFELAVETKPNYSKFNKLLEDL